MSDLIKADLEHIESLGISEEELLWQLSLLKKGSKPVTLTAAATPGNGVIILSAKEQEEHLAFFENRITDLSLIRFVPASGAASRMFKAFFQYLDDGVETKEIIYFAQHYQSFAFYDKIKCENEADYPCAINKMINTLKLADLPKALIPFHRYKDGVRTALEEHLVESALVLGHKTPVNIHFTISKIHQQKISQLIDSVLGKYEAIYGCDFNISFSYQPKSTDTIALNQDNELIRDEAGAITFRPGGHGSLIKNLNSLKSSLVYIKNIDNVQPDHLKTASIHYKKVLTGYLLVIQQEVKDFLYELDEGAWNLDKALNFIEDKLCIKIPESFSTFKNNEKKVWIYKKLNRPIRICGMVKNTGEPGGGPFWVLNNKNEISLQIVESSQIDLQNSSQKNIFLQSTHFNPVDIACWINDFQGNKFDLTKFSDPETAFITEKSQNGKSLKVLEHPGLWNGAMADWITLFVEVPIASFSPAKTINDLLKNEHQQN